MALDEAHQQIHSRFWLGIDGGGTNCRAAIVDHKGKVLGEGQAEAANLLRVGLDNAVANIKKSIHQACERAGIEPIQLTAACIGLAGVSQPGYHQQMLEALKKVLPISNVSLETDARVALAGATNNAPGVVIMAGTGSIACGVNARGQFARSGGWGPIMGDEGSGSYIGRRALEAVMMAWDYRGKPTSMREPVLKHFGVSTPPELTTVIYDSSAKEKGEVPGRIAQLSRIAVKAAQEGDQVAQEILVAAAKELSKTTIAVIRQLRMEQDTFRVAYVGGVFEAGELILKLLREEIQKVAPNAEISRPLESPVIGAVKMAQAMHA
jgi:N-acetylglucosamine kinase-like BadF-type ATPase